MDKEELNNSEWQVQKMCTDIAEYELIIEKQKTDWECDQKTESWKWIVSYHGSIVASGTVNSVEEAQAKAIANIPMDKESTQKAMNDDGCGCS